MRGLQVKYVNRISPDIIKSYCTHLATFVWIRNIRRDGYANLSSLEIKDNTCVDIASYRYVYITYNMHSLNRL